MYTGASLELPSLEIKLDMYHHTQFIVHLLRFHLGLSEALAEGAVLPPGRPQLTS